MGGSNGPVDVALTLPTRDGDDGLLMSNGCVKAECQRQHGDRRASDARGNWSPRTSSARRPRTVAEPSPIRARIGTQQRRLASGRATGQTAHRSGPIGPVLRASRLDRRASQVGTTIADPWYATTATLSISALPSPPPSAPPDPRSGTGGAFPTGPA
jgi:hypothetical protein